MAVVVILMVTTVISSSQTSFWDRTMQIQRHFTTGTNGTGTLGIAYETRKSKISNLDGTSVFEANVTVPSFWSQTATDMIAQKYMRKAQVPNKVVKVPEDNVPEWLQRSVPANDAVFGGETDAHAVFHRIAGCWTYWGWKLGYFDDEESAKNFYIEIYYILTNQLAAPNSPQWFNTGLHWAYGIEGNDEGRWAINIEAILGDSKVIAKRTNNTYERPTAMACFIQTLEDNLVEKNGILDFMTREAKIFKGGGGSGANYSKVRGMGEPLSGGGVSSGLRSFFPPVDSMAGAIKSGGTCLAPYTPLFTDKGIVKVKDLADSGEKFICLSYSPNINRYSAKFARAWKSGYKRVVRIITDKGSFDVTYDHPIKLSTGEYIEAEKLTEGQRLFAAFTHNRRGYVGVSLKTGKRGGGSRYWHNIIAKDLLCLTKDKIVHHKDHNKINNNIDNLEIITPSEHAKEHCKQLIENNSHVFQHNKYPKFGTTNPMHKSSNFWKSEERSTAFSEKQRLALVKSGRSRSMQIESVKQRMLNVAWKLINAGYDIPNFNAYVKAREKHIGRLTYHKYTKNSIDKYFGSYDNFIVELNSRNHRVIKIENIGDMDVYDVEVECNSPDTATSDSGHNFVIWSGDSVFGTGIAVHNTRRSARMIVLDLDHPDIEWFIDWKAREEKKVACLAAGSTIIRQLVRDLYTAVKDKDQAKIDQLSEHADMVGIPYEIVFQTIQCAESDLPAPVVEDMPPVYEGTSYNTVTGQNANNSVRVTNEFMEAVNKDGDWNLYWRVELEKARKENRKPKPCKTLKARKLWDDIARAAWECADPGLQFHDIVNDWNTVLNDGEIQATNPCQPGFAEVLTPEGIRTFDDIDVGSIIWSGKEWTKVIRKIHTGFKPVYYFRTKFGTFVGTENHNVFSNGEKIEVGKATEIDSCPTEEEYKAGVRPVTSKITNKFYADEFDVYEIEVDCEDHTYWSSGILCANCSEYNFLNDTSCNLACLNIAALMANVDNAKGIENIRYASHLLTIALDITVTMASYPSKEIAEGAYKYRTIGLGYSNLGGFLMRRGIAYDSDHGRAWAVLLTAYMHFQAALTSNMIAKDSVKLGTFPRWNDNKEHVTRVMKNHARYLGMYDGPYDKLRYTPPDVKHLISKYFDGSELTVPLKDMIDVLISNIDYVKLRNAQLTLIMPAGTVGLVMDCDTTGIEPDFSLIKHKKLSGGGYITIVNQAIEPALKSLNYTPEQIKDIIDHVHKTGGIHGAPHLKHSDLPVFDCAVPCGTGSRAVSVDGHMDMLGVTQPLMSGSASKTINMPHDATIDDIKYAYKKAYDLGLKCVALYRDNSKLSQPLNAKTSKKKESIQESKPEVKVNDSTLSRGQRKYLPGKRKGYTQKLRVGSFKAFLQTGEYPDGSLGEFFINVAQQGTSLHGMGAMVGKLGSLAIQYGAPLEEVVDTMRGSQCEPSGIVTGHEHIKMCTSLFDVVAKDLAINYLGRTDLMINPPTPQSISIPSNNVNIGQQDNFGIKYEGTPCPSCHNYKMVRDGKCMTCRACGTTTGCS